MPDAALVLIRSQPFKDVHTSPCGYSQATLCAPDVDAQGLSMPRLIQVFMKVGMLAAAGCFVASGAAMGQPISAPADSLFKSVPAPSTGKLRPTSALPIPRGLQSPCADAREHSLPLPTTVPPAEFVAFESRVLAFLQSGEYRQLGWCQDKGSEHSPVRDTGPFAKGVYYGTHPSVRIHYSPRAMKWLMDGRQGPIPDGAMIIKEQYQPPAARYNGLRDDQLPKVTDWTIMIKDSSGAKDGWFWGEFFDGMTFDDDKPPFQYPWAGFGLYCLRCHATAEKEHTFSALNNIRGFPGQPIEFPDDGTWRGQPIARALHRSSLAQPTRTPPTPFWEFLRTFTSIPGVVLKDVERMPSETYDNVVAPAAEGQYISSSQCMSCHAALNGPFGPTMFLPSPGTPMGTVAGANVSPYGEWRWSPMGLAGRDPVFFAQLESELAYLDTLPPPQNAKQSQGVTNACLSCHGAMGKRQLDTDTVGGQGDFKLDFLRLTDRSNPDFLYGALARDGISCAVCHRIVPDSPPPGAAPLEYFLNNSITGRFASSPPDTVFGPYKDDEISPYTMANAIGITPKNNQYLRSARMCGSCHTIELPVVDGKPGQTSLEQVTYLEWLNSTYQNEFGPAGPNARTCQDCHMPSHYHSAKKRIDVERLVQKMAIIADQDYPEAEHRAPEDELVIAERTDFKRHEFLGMNVFLLEMFRQFNEILGVRTTDYMSGSSTDLQDAIDNVAQQASQRTVEVRVSARPNGRREIEAEVAVTNLAGHRFPSGVGFRRAFIELLVLEDRGGGRETVLWASGRTNSVGVIVDGNGQVLPTEFFTEYTDPQGRRQQHFQPHHQVIISQDQVQIYEELVRDADGEFTTSFIRRDETIKDNRLLPIGWTEHGPDPSLNGRFLESTHAFAVHGDPDYANGKGTDRVTYKIQLPAGVDTSRTTVQATLYYQATPPSYLADRFKAVPNGAATQRLYYLASHLDLNRRPTEDWKLKVASARARPVGRPPLDDTSVAPSLGKQGRHQ